MNFDRVGAAGNGGNRVVENRGFTFARVAVQPIRICLDGFRIRVQHGFPIENHVRASETTECRRR
jgi:hypothetical protein